MLEKIGKIIFRIGQVLACLLGLVALVALFKGDFLGGPFLLLISGAIWLLTRGVLWILSGEYRDFPAKIKRKNIKLSIVTFFISIGLILYSTGFYKSIYYQIVATEPVPELVLKENTLLEVKTKIGTISIAAGKDLERRYEWGACVFKENMSVRPGRWYGRLGIKSSTVEYFPFLKKVLKTCKGFTAVSAEEGQIHFDDRKFVETWIKRTAKYHTTVWTNDGLLLRWRLKSPPRLMVDLWQICINGKRPKQLVGAIDHAFKLTGQIKFKEMRFGCAQVSKDVISSTRQALETNWLEIDRLMDRSK